MFIQLHNPTFDELKGSIRNSYQLKDLFLLSLSGHINRLDNIETGYIDMLISYQYGYGIGFIVSVSSHIISKALVYITMLSLSRALSCIFIPLHSIHTFCKQFRAYLSCAVLFLLYVPLLPMPLASAIFACIGVPVHSFLIPQFLASLPQIHLNCLLGEHLDNVSSVQFESDWVFLLLLVVSLLLTLINATLHTLHLFEETQRQGKKVD